MKEKKIQTEPGNVSNIARSHDPAIKSHHVGPHCGVIVPPMASAEVPSLAAHLLQAEARQAGIHIDIIYTNFPFAHIFGLPLYHLLVKLKEKNFIAERLFTRAAFGLPPMGKNVHRLIDPYWVPDHIWQRKNETATRKMADNLSPMRKLILSTDWQELEEQSVKYVETTAASIVERGYRIVGSTNTLGGIASSVAILNQIKKIDPRIVTAMGGALCDGEMAQGVLSLQTRIDYIFSGESDVSFIDFARDVLEGRQLPQEKIIVQKTPTNLDQSPLPDFHDYFRQVEEYHIDPPVEGTYPIVYETSRGCRWGRCVFCGLNGVNKSYRFKNPGKVLEDLRRLVSLYPESPIFMSDNLIPPHYITDLWPSAATLSPPLRIRYEVNSDLGLNDLMVLKQAGITFVQPGIESLSPKLLKRLRKNGTVRQNIALLRYARAVGIDLCWQLLFGVPGDRLDEYREMLELLPLIRHLQPPAGMIPIEIPRFSPYFNMPERFGIKRLRPAELYSDVYPGHADLEKLAYYFTGDFDAQSYEDPDILDDLRQEYIRWFNSWKPPGVVPGGSTVSQPPMLHLEQESPGLFVLYDTRGIPGLPQKMEIDKDKAALLVTERAWDNSEEMRWAVESKLGIARQNVFIPLVIARILGRRAGLPLSKFFYSFSSGTR